MKPTPSEIYFFLSTSLGALLAYLVGAPTAAMQALAMLNIADYATGMIASSVEAANGTGKGLNSRKGMVGILKKLGFWVLVTVGNHVDQALGQGGHTVRDAVVLFLLGNELLSIVENLGRAGIPVPPILTQVIQVLKKGSGEKTVLPEQKGDEAA